MILLDVSIRNTQAEAVRAAAISGSLIVKSGDGLALATLPLGLAPFGPAANGTINLLSPPLATAAAQGVATNFELRRQNNTLILIGSVGAAAGDLLISDTVINVGDTVVVSGLTYTVPGA